MSKMELTVQARDNGKESAKEILGEGRIPGVVYGHGFDAVQVQIDKKEFNNTLNEAGESTLIDLRIGDQAVGNVVIKDYQTDPMSGAIVHFDLHKVKMTEKMTANVEISFIGESPAVKNDGGVLVIGMDSIEIRCLPNDLISEIEIDLGGLEHVDDMIRVKDLDLPAAVEVLDEEENVVVAVEPQRSEAEMEGLEGKVEEDVNKVEGAVKEEKPAEEAKK